MRPLITVLFPIYNEAPWLESQFKLFVKEAIQKKVPNYELLVIENGSQDNSLTILRRLKKKYPQLRVLHLEKASHGQAIKRGLIAAKGKYIFVFSLDFFDLTFLKTSLSLLQKVDITIGSKTLFKSQDKRLLVRRLTSYFFNVLLRLTLNFPGSDTHGLKSFRNSTLLKKQVKKCITTAELFETELILRLHKTGATLVELPITVNEVRPSRTKLKNRVVSTLKDLLTAIYSKYFTTQFSTKEITADDYGISSYVNQAILAEAASGNVTTISILANYASVKNLRELVKKAPVCRYAIHLNLVKGKPLLPPHRVASLVNRRGYFYPTPLFFIRLVLGKINLEEVKKECECQINKLQTNGIIIDQIDSEQHTHTFPPIWKIVTTISNNKKIPYIRSIASTKWYLKKKRLRNSIYHFIILILWLRYGPNKKLSKEYHSLIVHPGTNFDPL